MKLPKDQRIDLRQHIKENPDQKLWEPFHSITDDGSYLIAAYCQPAGDSLRSIWILYKDPALLEYLPPHPIIFLHQRVSKTDPSITKEYLYQNSLSHDYWKHVAVFSKLRELLKIETDISHTLPFENTCSVCKFFEVLEDLVTKHSNVIVFSTTVDVALIPENVLSLLDAILESKKEDAEGTNVETFCSISVTLPPYYNDDNDLLKSFSTTEEREKFLKKYIGGKTSLIPMIADC